MRILFENFFLVDLDDVNLDIEKTSKNTFDFGLRFVFSPPSHSVNFFTLRNRRRIAQQCGQKGLILLTVTTLIARTALITKTTLIPNTRNSRDGS
jgi:hypothetical protein